MSSQELCSATDCPICCHPPSPHRPCPGLSQLPSRAVALTMGKIQVVCSDIATAAPAWRPQRTQPLPPQGQEDTTVGPVSAPLGPRRAGAGRTPHPQLCPEEGLSRGRTCWGGKGQNTCYKHRSGGTLAAWRPQREGGAQNSRTGHVVNWGSQLTHARF